VLSLGRLAVLETDSYECIAQWQDKKGKTVNWPMALAEGDNRGLGGA
jgi:hypothetical protein